MFRLVIRRPDEELSRTASRAHGKLNHFLVELAVPRDANHDVNIGYSSNGAAHLALLFELAFKNLSNRHDTPQAIAVYRPNHHTAPPALTD
jgi:hypothetical protein